MKIKRVLKLPLTWIALAMLICIITCGIVFKTHPIKVIPLCISCFVMLLQANVNRYAFLLGGLNSIIYAASGISMQLYANALYSFAVSFPLQMITFINWKKNTHNGQTETKRLSVKKRLFGVGMMLGLWAVLYLIFSGLNSPYMVLDNTASVLGLVTIVLCMLRYSEYAILQLVGSCFSMATYIQLTVDDISNIVWIIFTGYSLACTAISFINMSRQNRLKEKAV